MNIVFRVDASSEIGTGHVMRCLTLADLLREKGAQVSFVCQEIEGHLCDYIESKNYSCWRISCDNLKFVVQEDAEKTVRLLEIKAKKVDLVICDHYQIDYLWVQLIRKVVPKIIVIDDLANRSHDCDVLLDQNYYEDFETRYDLLVPNDCVKLLGPQYLLLRKEFLHAVNHSKERNGTVQRILVFFGGSDPTNETEKCLLALQKLEMEHNGILLKDIHIDVVVGYANPKRFLIEEICQQMDIHFYCQIDYIAELMAKADLSIGAGGVTMWERMVVGLPALTVIVADNQQETVEAASKFGAVWNLGWHENVKVANYADNIKECFEYPERLKSISEKGIELVGHKGTQQNWIDKFILNLN